MPFANSTEVTRLRPAPSRHAAWYAGLWALALAGLCGPARAADAPPRTAPFPDVPPGHWAYTAVETLRVRGILRGYPPEPARPPEVHPSAPPRAGRRAPARRTPRRQSRP